VSDFTTLPDLAALRLGGSVLEANDEFFAPKENLLKPEAPRFDPDAYTDRGKEMDGWETRRRREPGHDWCIVRLGAPGIVRGVVVDTSYFRGNFPERCALEATSWEGDDLDDAEWFGLLPQAALAGDTRNELEVDSTQRVTHLRFHIYPDGGVARLRVHGEPLPDLRAADALLDAAATANGGTIVDASDRFFSSPDNLIAPGEPRGMHDGWETRRRRGLGHDWVVVGLATEVEIERVEVDTSFFKGNYPEGCSLDVQVAGADLADEGWAEALGRRSLEPDRRHTFRLPAGTIATHVRLNIHPDGGVARFRVFGRVTDDGWRAFGTRWLNALPAEAFVREVLACCASTPWATEMFGARPFADFDELLEASDAAWAGLGPELWLEAFAAHPRIGERAGSAWSTQEQAGTAAAGEDLLEALAEGNRAYEARFGHVFLINATGKGPQEMLDALRRRTANDPEAELAEAAEQQRQITRLRLEKLVRPPG
jgi:allantoicase